MSRLATIDDEAKQLVERLIPYLTWQSEDVKDAYAAGEYIAAADGAIHDLGALRAELPEDLLKKIKSLIDSIELQGDAYTARFLGRMKNGILQMNLRKNLTQHQKTA